MKVWVTPMTSSSTHIRNSSCSIFTLVFTTPNRCLRSFQAASWRRLNVFPSSTSVFLIGFEEAVSTARCCLQGYMKDASPHLLGFYETSLDIWSSGDRKISFINRDLIRTLMLLFSPLVRQSNSNSTGTRDSMSHIELKPSVLLCCFNIALCLAWGNSFKIFCSNEKRQQIGESPSASTFVQFQKVPWQFATFSYTSSRIFQ